MAISQTVGRPGAVDPQAAAVRKPAITALAFSPNNQFLMVGSQSGVVGLAPDQTVACNIATQLEQILSMEFSPDGSMLAIAGGRPAIDGAVEIWSWPDRKLIATLRGHRDTVNDVAWHDQGRILASASADHSIKIWEVAKAAELQSLTGHSAAVLALAISPDQRWLCSASADSTIRVWKISDWSLRRTLNNHLDIVNDLTFKSNNPDDRFQTLASASDDGTVRIWYPEIGRLVRIIQHGEPVFSVAYGGSSDLFFGSTGGLHLKQGDGPIDVVHRTGSESWVISLATLSNINGQTETKMWNPELWQIVAGMSDGHIEYVEKGVR